MGYVKTLICKTLTIRGIGKIGTSQDRFVKSIWMVFVFSMSFLLIYATSKLVQEFLNYDLVIRISIKSNDYSTEFPSFSFCHHHPFGSKSKQYWDDGVILSPTKFNEKVRQKMKSYMEVTKTSPFWIFTQDDRRIYYQHLSTDEAYKLGWGNETFIFCTVFTGTKMEFGLDKQCDFSVQTLSIPQFFNCFSITPHDQNLDSRVTSITLLIRISGNTTDSLQHQKAFIPGIINQVSGLRGMVHERYTFPDIENEGFLLEPGKLIEINYAVIRKIKVATPKQPCSKNTRERITDLDQSFLFSQQACFKSLRGLSSLKHCSCFYADTMRSGRPNTSHPYCGNILNITLQDLIQRIKCLELWSSDFNKQIKDIFIHECKPSCVHFNYDTSLSVTKWLPTNWQLGWLIDLNQANNYFLSNEPKFASIPIPNRDIDNEEWKKKFDNYINSEDVLNSPKSGKVVDKNNFVMVVIKRRNFDTIEQKEKLTLDLYNLISRFGGLCSLCLGLTCAFAMEIVEMIYLAIYDNKKAAKENVKMLTIEIQENDFQHLDKNRCESPVWLSSL